MLFTLLKIKFLKTCIKNQTTISIQVRTWVQFQSHSYTGHLTGHLNGTKLQLKLNKKLKTLPHICNFVCGCLKTKAKK